MSIYDYFISNLDKLYAPEGFRWELIDFSHTKDILEWRNDKSNIELFYDQDKLTYEKQLKFIDTYSSHGRIDLVIVDCELEKNIGVYSIKNVEDRPELGKLLGDKDYRGKGLGKKLTKYLFDYWFLELNKEKIYAETRRDNFRNIKLNKSLGFKEIDSKKIEEIEFIIMVLSRENYI